MANPEFPSAPSGPLSQVLDKPPRDFVRADILKVIDKLGIERLTFHYTALDGKLKELKIPATDRAQAETVLAEGERVDGSSLFKGMVDMALSDLYVVPQYRTAFLNPFEEGSLDFVCRYLARDGSPAPFTLDNILGRAAGLFRASTGLDLRALGELEFFLLLPAGERGYCVPGQSGYHGSQPFTKSGPILNEMVRHIGRVTGAVKYAHGEVGLVDSVHSDVEEIEGRRAEQLEIEYLPRPVEEMADALVLGRWVIRNTAFRHGAIATFTPKIEEGVAGNGLHFHLELAQEGRNVMTMPDGRLSEAARKLIGGLCEYADSLTAFGNTVSSAYLRLVPNHEAPTRVCWSDLNRSALIRVPLGWTNVSHLAGKVNPREPEVARGAAGARQTVELRSPDGSALIHLVLAGIAMAANWAFGGDGSLFKEYGPLELADRLYVKGNIFSDKELLARLPVLPASCVESSRLLLKKRDLYERDGVFPSSVIDYVARMLEAENDEFMNKLLAGLPAHERLHEVRKIMHKDLHKH
ncbi:MAG TPA: glutamine synthetase beta-grasp domain-containing protein [Terriglobales bacterium]|nr:glutamine synthetase beta-grasp domain-containing protein [Terriglobales bacterium]